MTIEHTGEPAPRKPLRLWPGVVIVILQWLVGFGLPLVARDAMLVAMLGAVAGGLAIVVWWMFLSRAPWSERVGALALMIIAPIGTKLLVHESIAGAGMGMFLFILVIPFLSLALVLWAVASRRLAATPRRVSMVAAILLACGVFTLVRTGGISGDGNSDFHWRWTKTPEERLLAQAADEPATPLSPPAVAETPASSETSKEPLAPKSADEPAVLPAAPAAAKTGADWPGFRGPKRDGIVRGVRIATDWSASPPVEMWRQKIGPGWSSFAVGGGRLYTQEQRGDNEIVACYDVTTGKPIWRHRDAVRFSESNGGAGPRATPTVSNGRVYALGATGVMNVLDARSGSVVWSRNAVSDTGAKIPGWGISGSPLVVGDVVIVAASGRLVAYDLATGTPRWFGPARGGSYSSPQLLTIGGVAQILMLSGDGAASVAPADGTLLWEDAWPGGVFIVQPAVTADGDVLFTNATAAGGLGTRRLHVARGPGGWTVEERWTSNGLKPYFNDFVVHQGHAFGFDGNILACIDLEDGKRSWKGGRYGNGQLVLLEDEEVLLVLSEEGELALVKASPDQYTEIARFPALEGKTWNHPVLAGDVLLVRNGEEMAAFRLSLASR